VKHRVVWAQSVWEAFNELPDREREAILERMKFLEHFPHMYPIRTGRRRFRRHR
jgi:hypothetical protein